MYKNERGDYWFIHHKKTFQVSKRTHYYGRTIITDCDSTNLRIFKQNEVQDFYHLIEKQTNKQTKNKQKPTKQTNKQTNKHCFVWLFCGIFIYMKVNVSM